VETQSRHTPASSRPSALRSRVTNRPSLNQGVDQRTSSARRWRDLFEGYLEQANVCKEDLARVGLCRRAASLSVLSDGLDAKVARGENVDAELLVRQTGALGRVLASLGLADWQDSVRVVPPPLKPDLKRLRDPKTWKGTPS
jgi:hypothetical protein